MPSSKINRNGIIILLDYHRYSILDIVKTQPDITLMQLKMMISEEKGMKASVFCVWAFLKREKMSYKKLCMRQNATEIMWLKRVLFGTIIANRR